MSKVETVGITVFGNTFECRMYDVTLAEVEEASEYEKGLLLDDGCLVPVAAPEGVWPIFWRDHVSR